MKWKNIVKRFRRVLARYGMFFTAWLFKRLSYPMMQKMIRVFLFIGSKATLRHYRIALESLKIAYGDEKSLEELKQIATKCFESVGRSLLEMAYFSEHPEMMHDKIVIEGKEHLDKALEKGRGVVAVTAHFGNFPLMMTKMALDGCKAYVLMRRTRDKKIDKFLLDGRTKLRLQTVFSMPRRQCVQESLRALKKNGVLFILMDQHFGSEGGVHVDFFGQKAATAPGAVVFAKRAHAPVVPFFIVREQDDRYRIIIEPEMELEDRVDNDEMIYVNVDKITKIIERYIRMYPHEWGWMHRRWKGQSKIE